MKTIPVVEHIWGRHLCCFTFPLLRKLMSSSLVWRHNVWYEFFVQVMTSKRGWKKSNHTLWRQSFDMTISHMAVSQSKAMNYLKKIIIIDIAHRANIRQHLPEDVDEALYFLLEMTFDFLLPIENISKIKVKTWSYHHVSLICYFKNNKKSETPKRPLKFVQLLSLRKQRNVLKTPCPNYSYFFLNFLFFLIFFELMFNFLEIIIFLFQSILHFLNFWHFIFAFFFFVFTWTHHYTVILHLWEGSVHAHNKLFVDRYHAIYCIYVEHYIAKTIHRLIFFNCNLFSYSQSISSLCLYMQCLTTVLTRILVSL